MKKKKEENIVKNKAIQVLRSLQEEFKKKKGNEDYAYEYEIPDSVCKEMISKLDIQRGDDINKNSKFTAYIFEGDIFLIVDGWLDTPLFTLSDEAQNILFDHLISLS